MTEESLKSKTVKGVIWSGLERFSVQGVGFIVTLIIARILDPKDYGLVGMLTVFMAVAQALIDSGFTQALIRKQDRTEIDNSTVFYFNIIASFVVYSILYFGAPWVADFYDEPQLCKLMRVLCLIVIINSFAIVQRATYTASINFKIQAKASFIAAIVSGAVGIYLAYNGYGVWTLVWQQLLNAGINTLLLWIYSSWFPKWLYSWESFRELFAFGSKLLVTGLLNTFFENLYLLVIGKFFNASSLGFYSQADRVTKLPSSNITHIIQRVAYPVLCKYQGDDIILRENYRIFLRLSAFIIFPLMCFLAGISYPLVEFLLGEKWCFTATLMIPLCFSLMWYPTHSLNLILLQVKGRSDLFMKLEIIKKIFLIGVLIISIPFGLLFMCYVSIFTSIVCLIINTFYTGKLINAGFFVQMQDLARTIALSMLIFITTFFLSSMISNTFLSLVLDFLCGFLLFWGISKLFRFPEVSYLRMILK